MAGFLWLVMTGVVARRRATAAKASTLTGQQCTEAVHIPSAPYTADIPKFPHHCMFFQSRCAHLMSVCIYTYTHTYIYIYIYIFIFIYIYIYL